MIVLLHVLSIKSAWHLDSPPSPEILEEGSAVATGCTLPSWTPRSVLARPAEKPSAGWFTGLGLLQKSNAGLSPPALQTAPGCPPVSSSVDTGGRTSLAKDDGPGRRSPSCIFAVRRRQPWLPFRASLFKPSCLTDRIPALPGGSTSQHSAPQPGFLRTAPGACVDSRGLPER